eukprot:6132899-Amphidinium_carterae.3
MAKPKTGLSKDIRGDGHHIRSGGKELCFTWNRQASGCQSSCPWGRLHVCEWCLQSHRAVECPAHPSWTPSKSAGKGSK